MRFKIHRAELPDFQSVVDPADEAASLLFLSHLEPVLNQDDSRSHECLFDWRRHFEAVLGLFLGAEPHYPLDQRAGIPTPIEEHDLSGSGQMRDKTLNVELRFFTIGRGGKRHHPEDTRADSLCDAFDRATLSGRVTSLE